MLEEILRIKLEGKIGPGPYSSVWRLSFSVREPFNMVYFHCTPSGGHLGGTIVSYFDSQQMIEYPLFR